MKNLATAVAMLAFAAAAGSAGELAGVTLPDRAVVGDTTLVLNGMGLRKKAVFKVYVGALYLAQKSSDPAAILAADAPRRMVMHFLRDVGKDRLVEAWQEGLSANAPTAQSKLASEFQRFLSFWRDVKEGEQVMMTYLPGKGTSVSFAGQEVGTIAGKEFADALLAVWLGPKPPSEELKAGILGK
ncbi:MAG: chalcone isomerase family protein [Thermoanaerobaculum sp.]|nr:chalcone isomerase family protein [Thermoanaerobaculum sp.]MCX7894597.1 chalcone isomerase family protein [Thermoanaerobaculum sp.]MDW7967291.1 chalcone isomerase family protein [Thermoanaerobaculum sp.]